MMEFFTIPQGLWVIFLTVSFVLGMVLTLVILDYSFWENYVLPEWYIEQESPVWPFQAGGIVLVCLIVLSANQEVFELLKPFHGDMPWLYVVPSFFAFVVFCVAMALSAVPTIQSSWTKGMVAVNVVVGTLAWLVCYGVMHIVGF